MLTQFQFSFHRKFIKGLYAQLLGNFQRARIPCRRSIFRVARHISLGYSAFRALTAALIDGAGNDATTSRMIGSNANYFGGQL